MEAKMSDPWSPPLQQQERQQQPQLPCRLQESVSHYLTVVEKEETEATPLLRAKDLPEPWNSKLEASQFHFRQICKLTGRTVAYGLIAILLCGLPVVSIVMGAGYLYDCPAKSTIPAYLLAFGSVFLARLVLLLWQSESSCAESPTDVADSGTSPLLQRLTQMLEVALLVLIVLESIDVYTLFLGVDGVDDSSTGGYCHPVLFKFTFWMLAALYLTLVAAVLIAGVRSCCRAAVRSGF